MEVRLFDEIKINGVEVLYCSFLLFQLCFIISFHSYSLFYENEIICISLMTYFFYYLYYY